MKRLMISGFACPKEPWIAFLGPGTLVISLHDVLSATQSTSVADWGQHVADEIRRLRPDSIVAHDFGGAIALRALLELRNKRIPVHGRLTLLNTVFRDFSVFKHPHPFLIQILPWHVTADLIEASGGGVDPQLKPWFGKIRDVYRQIVAASLGRAFQGRFRSRKRPRSRAMTGDLGLPVQIIASTNDPYTSMQDLRHIQEDFQIPDFYELAYGHFPYSAGNRHAVKELIHHFEAVPKAVHAR